VVKWIQGSGTALQSVARDADSRPAASVAPREWADVDLSALNACSGRQPRDAQCARILRLAYHCAAVVASIPAPSSKPGSSAGRCTRSSCRDGVESDGTVHFNYLLTAGGGLLDVAAASTNT